MQLQAFTQSNTKFPAEITQNKTNLENAHDQVRFIP
jgi:hypothetical protein